MVATRLRDTAFKRELATMPLGTAVKIEGPGGNLVLHNNPDRTAVFLAGGIGVTPIRSILLWATKQKLAHCIYFFFSNRRPENTPFLEELQALQQQNPNYAFVATMTQMETSHREWKEETGYINQDILAKYVKNTKSPIYYIVGPPGMVKGLQMMLNVAGIDDDDIRTDEFAGY
jgi:ferredoxin-NADP reductase